MGLPIWRYQDGELALEKRLHLPYRQNTVLSLRIDSAGDGAPKTSRFSLRPLIQFRENEAPVHSAQPDGPYALTVTDDTYEISRT